MGMANLKFEVAAAAEKSANGSVKTTSAKGAKPTSEKGGAKKGAKTSAVEPNPEAVAAWGKESASAAKTSKEPGKKKVTETTKDQSEKPTAKKGGNKKTEKPTSDKAKTPAKTTKTEGANATSEKPVSNPNKVGKPFAAILRTLANAKTPLTRKEISARTGIKTGFTSLIGHSDPTKVEPQSLIARGFIRLATEEENSDRIAAYLLTPVGANIVKTLNG